MEIAEQIASLNKDVQESLKKIENGYVTKAGLAKLEEEFKALKSLQEKQHLENKTDPIFGNKLAAEGFVDTLKGAINRSYLVHEGILKKDSPWHVEKSDLNSYGTGTGVELVPTATSDVLSQLLVQASVMRGKSTMYPGLAGNLVLPKRAAGSTAVFTASSGLKDDAAVTPSAFTTASITLSPKQVSAISLASDKLLYVSAVPIAENIAIDLVEQAGLLENTVCYKGDGTATAGNGSITGLKTASGINATTAPTVANFALDPIKYMLQLRNLVHQSVIEDPANEYLISANTDTLIRQGKASTAGSYFFDPSKDSYVIGGKKVNYWHVMDAGSTIADVPVLYGNFRKATVLGTGREMGIEVSRDFKFSTNQVAFRLTYDFDFSVLQSGALARIVLT